MSLLETPVQLIITERDVREYGDFRIAEALAGKSLETLGASDSDLADELMKLLPKIITEKLQKMLVGNFEISEITISMKVRGNFAIVGLDGDLQLKLKPKGTR
jgi:hypothetical protein